MTKPQALLFDWDNTLVDTWPTIHEALNHTLRRMEHPEWSLAQVKAEVKQSMREAFPVLFGKRWEEAAQTYQDYYRSIHLRNLRALEGAEAMLQMVREQPVYVAVVSNKRGVNLRQELVHLGWEAYFDMVVGADDAEYDKPHPAPVQLALQTSSVTPGEAVWFIGDTIIDLECAQNTGTTPVLYGAVDTDDGHYLGFPFRHHVRNHEDLQSLISKALA